MTSSISSKPRYTWRVVDIVVAAVVAVAGGVIFWAWSALASGISVLSAGYPPLSALWSGGWFIPAVLGGLLIRKPGAALFCETVAAAGELIAGSQYGGTVLLSGLIQGLGAELVFAAFRYRSWRLPAALLAGAATGLFCGINDCFLPWSWNIEYTGDFKAIYIVFCMISGAVIAGLLSWLATRGLARTGALSSLASRNAAKEPIL
ncbi:energy-coupling factor transport system substrate-specific component [Psychromicrobium silvestre]|uniref:Energy-coupling factor transport system substrate-specific component n=1 Tax=Psychromicrobium silvestre TaxID=1645614 RepID=A0A7Y9S877_9MICC|nr:ECF transporter S component [Psychromicrobium silvestre]NYE95691.1 energy-coupling factor transport system substrate-specific component [Psychromicrobium silvestre]